jgi:polysaccharide biosynthesis PFTS motif protein
VSPVRASHQLDPAVRRAESQAKGWVATCWRWLREGTSGGVVVRARSHRLTLRQRIRGYARLKKAKGFRAVRDVNATLADVEFVAPASLGARLVFGAECAVAHVAARQFLFQLLGGKRLNMALLSQFGAKDGRLRLPMPKAWRGALADCDLVKPSRWNSLRWVAFISRRWAQGVAEVFSVPWKAAAHRRRRKVVGGNDYAFFCGLTQANVPEPSCKERRHDVCSWYAHWKGRSTSIVRIGHGVDRPSAMQNGVSIESMPEPYELVQGLVSWSSYLGWGMVACLAAGFELLRGRWIPALLLREAAMAKAVSLTPRGRLAKEYFLHCSGSAYRPLWTYAAEKAGARIVAYYYSISEQPRLPDGSVPRDIELRLSSWPEYLVWDDYQAQWVRNGITKPANVSIAGPIEFSDSKEALPFIPQGAVAVFDVSLYRSSVHMGFSTMADFFAAHPGGYYSFLSDCHRITKEMSIPMAFKTKRDIGRRGQTRYRRLVEQVIKDERVIAVSPGISATRVVRQCQAVISAPFTSTALLAPDVPSAFYDPTGWMQKDDRAAHGLPVITGPDELRAWLAKVFGQQAMQNA